MTFQRHTPGVVATKLLFVVPAVPLLTGTTWLNAGGPLQLVWPGGNSLNVIDPPAPLPSGTVPLSFGMSDCVVVRPELTSDDSCASLQVVSIAARLLSPL